MNKVNTNQLSKIQSRINENNKSPEHFCDTYITTLQELKRKSNTSLLNRGNDLIPKKNALKY